MRNLDNAAAYMLLVTSNAQGELTALERGRHALHSGMDVRSYAESVGRKFTTVSNERRAAEVAKACTDIGTRLSDYFSQLVEIHASPAWLWPALVDAMLEGEWSVNDTREHVQRFKDLPKEFKEARRGWMSAAGRVG